MTMKYKCIYSVIKTSRNYLVTKQTFRGQSSLTSSSDQRDIGKSDLLSRQRLEAAEATEAAAWWAEDIDGTGVALFLPSSMSSGRNDGGEGICPKRVSTEFSSRSRASVASYSSPDRCSVWWRQLSCALFDVSQASKGVSLMFWKETSFFVFKEIAGRRDIVNAFVTRRNHVERRILSPIGQQLICTNAVHGFNLVPISLCSFSFSDLNLSSVPPGQRSTVREKFWEQGVNLSRVSVNSY